MQNLCNILSYNNGHWLKNGGSSARDLGAKVPNLSANNFSRGQAQPNLVAERI